MSFLATYVTWGYMRALMRAVMLALWPLAVGMLFPAYAARHRNPVGLDLSTGGTFSRGLAAFYFTQAPTDGSSAFLASAGSGVRRASENRGDGYGVGLLMEKSATNYMLRSRALDNAAWTNTANISAVNANGGPDGSNLADRLTLLSGGVGVYQIAPGPAGAVIGSHWCRAVSGTNKNQIYTFDNSGTHSLFARGVTTTTTYQRNDTSGGVATTNSGMIVGDGRNLSGAGVTVLGIDFGAHTEDNYVDMVQLEVGYYPTSPIDTAGAAVTRPQDVLSYADGEYPPELLTTGGVIRFAFDASSAEINNSGELWYLIAGGSSNDCVVVQGGGSGTCNFRLFCSGSMVAEIVTVAFARGDYVDVTFKPQAGYLAIDGPTTGFASDTGTGVAWPAMTDIFIGDDGGSSGPVTGRYLDAAGIGKPSIGLA